MCVYNRALKKKESFDNTEEVLRKKDHKLSCLACGRGELNDSFSN